MERLRDLFFVDVRAVRVGRVDEVDAQLDGAPQHVQRVLAVQRPAPDARPAQTHRAEAEPVDGQVAADGDRGCAHGEAFTTTTLPSASSRTMHPTSGCDPSHPASNAAATLTPRAMRPSKDRVLNATGLAP